MISIKEKYTVSSIDNNVTHDWLLHKHYAKRLCSISYAFGIFDENNILQGVCTFGSPPSRALCVGVCVIDNVSKVFELNRFIINDNRKNMASFFIGKCLLLLPKNIIIVSYADTSKNHHGYIYQSTNWIYTGLSAKRTERFDPLSPNKHSKTVTQKVGVKYKDLEVRERPQKHRYVYFTGSKTEKKHLKNQLNYKVYPYPKGENINYDSSFTPKVQLKLF